MRALLIINEAPHYLGCLNTPGVSLPQKGEYVKYDKTVYMVTHVMHDVDQDEVNIHLTKSL